MRKTVLSFVGALALIGFAASSGNAKPALKDVPQITEGLIATGIAYEISRVCDDIDARTLRGINFLWGLKQTARDMGYTEAEIDAFVDDKAEKAALEAEARKRLVEMGAVGGNTASYCAVGQAEIARQSAVGQLLR